MKELNKIFNEVEKDFSKDLKESKKRHFEVKQGKRRLVLTKNRYGEFSSYPEGDRMIGEHNYSTLIKVRVLSKEETAKVKAVSEEMKKLRKKYQDLLKRLAGVEQ